MSTANGSPPALIAYDGTDDAGAAIAAAAHMLGGRQAVVLSVYDTPLQPIVPTAAPGMVVAPTAADPERTEALEKDSAAAGWRIAEAGVALARQNGLVATPEVRAGFGGAAGTWSAIVEAARELDASVIVIGGRHGSAIKAALLGSVSDGVVHHADRPVLVIPHDEHRD